MSVKFFISHASEDKELAQALADALRGAFEINRGEIRLTSVAGYAHPIGSQTSSELRNDLIAAKVVFGVLTPLSANREWVLFELGAAWGMSKNPIALTARGLSLNDLPGPLKESNAIDLCADDARDRVLSVFDEIYSDVKIPQRETPLRIKAAEALANLAVKFSKIKNVKASPPVKPTLREQLIKELNRLVERDRTTIFLNTEQLNLTELFSQALTRVGFQLKASKRLYNQCVKKAYPQKDFQLNLADASIPHPSSILNASAAALTRKMHLYHVNILQELYNLGLKITAELLNEDRTSQDYVQNFTSKFNILRQRIESNLSPKYDARLL